MYYYNVIEKPLAQKDDIDAMKTNGVKIICFVLILALLAVLFLVVYRKIEKRKQLF